jgi:2-haloacid dehalogenase
VRYLFDVNETVLDMSPLDALLGGGERRTAWFTLLIRTALVRTAAGDHRPFGALGLDAAHALGVEVGADELRAAMARLPAHDDVRPGLEALVAAGHEVHALGNSARDLVEEQLAYAGVRDLFAAVHSAEDAGVLKPGGAAYLHALGDADPAETWLVAAHDWDVAGARLAGLRTSYVDRGLAPPLPGLGPDRTVRDLTELVT